MKKLVLLLLINFWTGIINAQICEELGSSELRVETGDVIFNLSHNGYLFTENEEGLSYVYPKTYEDGSPGYNIIRKAGISVGGRRDGNLFVSSSELRPDSIQSGFKPGPVLTDGVVTTEMCRDWDKHFQVSRKSLVYMDSLRHQLRDPNTHDVFIPFDLIPDDVLGWPARGNPFFNEIHGFDLPFLPSFLPSYLAPFMDLNSDGFYDPRYGDLPVAYKMSHERTFKENAYDMTFWIINDLGSRPSGLALRCQVNNLLLLPHENSELDGPYFQFLLVNRAPQNFDSIYFSVWTDFSSGCDENDYFGTLPDQSIYHYSSNGVGPVCENDEDVRKDGIVTLGAFPYSDEYATIPFSRVVHKDFENDDPNIWIHFIDEWSTDSVLIRGDEVVYRRNISMPTTRADSGAPGPTNYPVDVSQLYGLMSGIWADGTPMTRKRMGYNPGDPSVMKTREFMDSQPNDPDGWNRCNDSFIAGNPIFFHSSQSRLALNPERSMLFTYRYHSYHEEENMPCPQLPYLVNDIQGDFISTSIDEPSPVKQKIKYIDVYPNPTSDILIIKPFRGVVDLKINLIDLAGKIILNGQNTDFHLDISDVESGYYFLKVEGRKGVQIEKILKL